MTASPAIYRCLARAKRKEQYIRWCAGVAAPAETEDHTEFDALVEKLGLTGKPEAWPYEPRLRRFAERNKKYKYVPEFLLKHWGMAGDVELCA